MGSGGRFIEHVEVAENAPCEGYPFTLPAVEWLRRSGGITFPSGASFLVGENGSGKSTLVEALAVAAGMNAEGGSQNFRFHTRSSESELSSHLTVTWGWRKPQSRFFLRAESFYNVATEVDRLGPDQIAVVGGTSLHERSHGESFVDLMRHRFHPRGLYLLDEPEAALSPRGCMAVLALLYELIDTGCQIVIATHSPILLALPGATIFEIDDDGEVMRVDYDDAMPVRLTRHFLDRPDAILRTLLH